MGIKEPLKQAAIEELKNLDLNLLNLYARHNHETIILLHEQKIIDDENIEFALEDAVIKQARRYYQLITKKDSFPDHVGMPEVLAYALKRGDVFSEKEINKISFDHGQTAEAFAETYACENLLGNLREELLNPKPIPKFLDGYYDPHPACCC